MWTAKARLLRSAARVAALAVLAALAAVAAAPLSARAQSAAPAPQGEGAKPRPGLLDTILQGPNLRTTAPEPKDWVKASRPAEAREPRRVQPDAEPRRAMLTPEQIRAREAELDNLRARHDRLGERQPARGPFASAAPPAAAAAAGQKGPGCAIACAPAAKKKKVR